MSGNAGLGVVGALLLGCFACGQIAPTTFTEKEAGPDAAQAPIVVSVPDCPAAAGGGSCCSSDASCLDVTLLGGRCVQRGMGCGAVVCPSGSHCALVETLKKFSEGFPAFGSPVQVAACVAD
jgi:hypothetical protein